MKSKSKSEEEKVLDLKIKETRRLEHLINDVQRVVAALKKCDGDLEKAEKILEAKWGKENAKTMFERYHNFNDKDSKHHDNSQSIITFFKSYDKFRNQIKKKSR